LPADWKIYVDPENENQLLFVNIKTRVSQWERPVV
jgi:WW domain